MNVEEIRDYCLSLKGAEEGFPFGSDTLVLKVGGKIFALINLDGPLTINLKCDPDEALELRERYPSVTPGYHMNKRHWNTVLFDGSLPDSLVLSMINRSYALIFSSLPEKRKNEINIL